MDEVRIKNKISNDSNLINSIYSTVRLTIDDKKFNIKIKNGTEQNLTDNECVQSIKNIPEEECKRILICTDNFNERLDKNLNYETTFEELSTLDLTFK